MAAKGTTGAPTTVAEGLNTVAQALVQCMSAPDAGVHMPQLDQMLKMTIALIQTKGQAGGPQGAPEGPGAGGPPPGGPGGGPMGAGGPMGGAAPAGLAGILGGGGGPAGPGGSGRMSQSGASADDVRRLIASAQSARTGTGT